MGGLTFHPSATQYTPIDPYRGSDGKLYIIAYAHAALTAKTPYLVIVNEFGNVTKAQTDGAFNCWIGVPNDTYASGDMAVLQVGGYIKAVITPSLSMSVGHSFLMFDGAITDGGADYSGATSEFAIAATESTTSSTQDMMLAGRMVLTTT